MWIIQNYTYVVYHQTKLQGQALIFNSKDSALNFYNNELSLKISGDKKRNKLVVEETDNSKIAHLYYSDYSEEVISMMPIEPSDKVIK